MSNEIQMYDKTTALVDWTIASTKPMVVHCGGTSSSKTYSLMQVCFMRAIQNPGCVITVVGQDVPNLKKGAVRDAHNIVAATPKLADELLDYNKSNRIYETHAGSIIEFNSYDDAQDAKSGKRDFLFANEANGIPYPIFEELDVRTTQQTYIDFNPTAAFWAHERIYPDTAARDWITSTFEHNPFIEPSVKRKILSYEPTPENIARGTANKYRWQVYGQGKLGRLEGLVFPDFETTTEWPEQYKWRCFGLDFGFTNDPTALVEIRYAHGALYWRELIYEKRLTNPKIARRLEQLGHPKNERIIADSAEPKSIKELKNKGWYVKGATKGQGSVNAGIDALQRYPIRVHASSKNLIEEFSSYTWQIDRDGNPTNKPIDAYNHGIDAGRYAIEKQLLGQSYDYTSPA